MTHPRTAGTFARSWDRLVRAGLITAPEFVRRASLLPAQVLSSALGRPVPKGSLSVGNDADVVVLAADAYLDRATYAASTTPSSGVRHLLVHGESVVSDGRLELAARPGRPVRRTTP